MSKCALEEMVPLLHSVFFVGFFFVFFFRPVKTENDQDEQKQNKTKQKKAEADWDPACYCGLCLEKITADAQSAVHASCLAEILCLKVLPVNT